MTEERAVEIASSEDGVAAWVGRYPGREPRHRRRVRRTEDRDWTVKAWSGDRRADLFARVDDLTGLVEGRMDRPAGGVADGPRRRGAFGGKRLNSLPVWLGFCAVFFLGLADLRRLRSVRNLDLLVLVSLAVSLWFFNEGRIFTSVPLVYPVLLYLLGRTLWIGARTSAPSGGDGRCGPCGCSSPRRCSSSASESASTSRDSNVIDVGYSGVIGAQRIANGQAPYGHFPQATGASLRAAEDRNGRASSSHPGRTVAAKGRTSMATRTGR